MPGMIIWYSIDMFHYVGYLTITIFMKAYRRQGICVISNLLVMFDLYLNKEITLQVLVWLCQHLAGDLHYFAVGYTDSYTKMKFFMHEKAKPHCHVKKDI